MIGIIIQARTGSSRFPRKIYADINGKSTLQRVLDGCFSAKVPHKIILAMPEYDKDEILAKISSGQIKISDNRFNTFFGHPDDLVDRYYKAAVKFNVDLIVRITADCPLIQGQIIDEMICHYMKNGYNGFLGNNELVSTQPYPHGTDVEIFPYWMLAEIFQLTNDPVHREHVTPFMYRRGTEYKIHGFTNCRPNKIISMKHQDLSFDTDVDYQLIKKVAKKYDDCGDLNKAILEV